MNLKYKKSKYIYRKLKISDYQEFSKLFKLCFKKKLSLEFFKWRYFKNKSSFCFGIFNSSKMIANVGMVSLKLNNKKKEKILSRHSSMVLKKFREKKIYSNLLKKVKKKVDKKVDIIVMWPNANNYSNFGIEQKYIIKRKFFLYKTLSEKRVSKNTKDIDISEIVNHQKFIIKSNSLFLKNFDYFFNRYLTYKKNDYFLNKYENKKFSSFFIIKKNIDRSGINYVVLDHFGCEELRSKHLSYLVKEKNKLIFLSKRKIQRSNFKLLNNIFFNIGFIRKSNFKIKKKFIFNKNIFLGDTDIFISV